jgi:hypothetical protein
MTIGTEVTTEELLRKVKQNGGWNFGISNFGTLSGAENRKNLIMQDVIPEML